MRNIRRAVWIAAALTLGLAGPVAAGVYAFAGVASWDYFYVDMKSLKVDPQTKQVFALVLDIPPSGIYVDDIASPTVAGRRSRFDYRIIRETVDCAANTIKLGAFVRYRFGYTPPARTLIAPASEDFEPIAPHTMEMNVADVMCDRRPHAQMREFIGDASEIAKRALPRRRDGV